MNLGSLGLTGFVFAGLALGVLTLGFLALFALVAHHDTHPSPIERLRD